MRVWRHLLLLAFLIGPVPAQHVHTGASTPDLDATYPGALADLNSLCSAMPFMAACSVAKACNASGSAASEDPDVCSSFNQLATVCSLDEGMGMMQGCLNYRSICNVTSTVKQCQALPGISSIPTTKTINTQVRSICEEMSMDGCEQCMPSWQDLNRTWGDCDLLDVYGSLCYQMSDMPQCDAWHTMCSKDPSLWICYTGSSAQQQANRPPVMKMYFFDELPFYLLFKTWVPRTSADMAGAWFAVFVLALAYELLQMLYSRYEADLQMRLAGGGAAAAAAGGGAGCCGAPDLEQGKQGKHVIAWPTTSGNSGPVAEGQEEEEEGHCPACAVAVAAATPAVPAPASKSGIDIIVSMNGGASSGQSCCGKDMNSTSSKSLLVANGKGSAAAAAAAALAQPPPAAWASWVFGDPQLLLADVVRGLARFVLAGLAYLLMLAVMSFNVSIFFAVITGLAVGTMMFGRWRRGAAHAAPSSEGYSHCGCGSS